jgi:AAA domain
MLDLDFQNVAQAVLGRPLPERALSHERPAWLPVPVPLDGLSEVASRPIEYSVDGLLMSGRAHLLTGMGNASKTTLLNQFAVGIATGTPVLGWPVMVPGHAVLLLAEDTAEDAQRRIYDILNSLLIPSALEAQCRERLHLFAVAGQDCTLVGGPDQGRRLAELIDHCNSLGNVRLIGLDPAIAMSRGRELDELDQRALANAMEKLALETGASVVLVSHAAKSIQYQSEIGSHYSRGSGALTDALRLEMLLRVMTTKEAKSFGVSENDRHHYVRFQVTKANRLPPSAMAPRWFMRSGGGVLVPAALEIAADNGNRLKPRDIEALQLFIEVDELTGELAHVSLKFPLWKERCLAGKLLTGSTPAAQDMSARRLLQSLQQRGLVEQTATSSWHLTDASLEAIGHDK